MRAIALVALAEGSSGCLPGCPTGGDFTEFSICQLTAETTDIVFARYDGPGASIPYVWSQMSCQGTYASVHIEVTNTLKGTLDSGTVDIAVGNLGDDGSFGAASAQDGLFFLWPYAGGRLGIAPTGGFFFRAPDGGWENDGLYRNAGLSDAELAAKIADPDGGCQGGR
jgi:hypothetical protein